MLAIAACNTDVSTFILDEPAVNLDTSGIQKVMRLVGTMLEGGKAVVIVTHDKEIARLASRVVVIENGRVVFDGLSGQCPLLQPRA